jgi:cell wall-associated NlpC family hydrolase
MTGYVDATGATGADRLAALRQRSRPARTQIPDGLSFETLLLEAANREAAKRAAAAEGGQQATTPWTRPQGALGAAPVSSTPTIDNTGTGAIASGSNPQRAAGGTLVNGGSAAGQAVIDAAKEHLGVPYLWGGTDEHNGFDCSGLIQDAYEQIGVEMPKWSRHQATMGVEVASIAEALPGDVLAFGDPVNHVSLYVGDGQMLHAPKTGEVVKIEEIDRPIASIRRIVTPNAGQAVGGTSFANAAVANGSVASAAAPTVSHSPGASERLYQPLFESAGQEWDVDPALLAAVAKTESAFNPNAVSHVGAQGLMQFMPATAAEMGVDAFDPASAVDGAARYLRKSLDQFGSFELAIASYNAGRGAVSRYGGIPPYPETQNYVEKVLEAWRSRS